MCKDLPQILAKALAVLAYAPKCFFQMQFPSLRLLHHAEEVAAGATLEVVSRLTGHDGYGYCRTGLSGDTGAENLAGFAPQAIGNPKPAAHPPCRLDELAPVGM